MVVVGKWVVGTGCADTDSDRKIMSPMAWNITWA